MSDDPVRVVLKPRETMKQVRAKKRLADHATAIHDVVRSEPGIPSRRAIAARTGLSVGRVTEVMRRMNDGETGHIRLEYGTAPVKSGRWASRAPVWGWFAMNRRAHHAVMDQADEHSAKVEVGVRRSRLVRFAQAQGIRNAEAIVDRLAQRLDLSIEAMTDTDLEAFEERLVEVAAIVDGVHDIA
jgi:hypothetical protein